MNSKKIVLMIISVAIIAFAFSLLKDKEEVPVSPINIEIGQEFLGIEYPNTKYVLNYKIADLNGDAVNDVIIFVGEKDSVESIKTTNADIVFYDGALQKYIKGGLKKFDGNTARLELADLTGDKLMDVILILNDDNGDKNLRIITLLNNELKEIFKAKDNKYITFTGNFIDGFKVCINNKKLNINKELDIKDNSSNLIENGVFDGSGKFLNSDTAKIKTTGFIEFEFVQLSNSMGIKTKQRIITQDKKNIVDEITIIWKYEEGKWQIKEASGLKLGNLLY